MRAFETIILSALAVALHGCGSGDGDGRADAGIVDAGSGDATATTDAGIAAACPVTFRFDGAAAEVAVAGEWDWDAPTAMTPTPGGGHAATIELPPGRHAYKLIVDGAWILDPARGYRTYHGDVENSLAIVGDCNRPTLTLEAFERAFDGQRGTASARIAVRAGVTGAAVAADRIEVTLRHDFADRPVDFERSGEAITLALADLAPGKYTLLVQARDARGRQAAPLRLPFWIEAEAFDWRDSPIYMIMVDRFANGEPTNDGDPLSAADPGARWHGGDLAGVTAAIESGVFEELGVRTLWLSPLARAASGVHDDAGRQATGYHGYWPVAARELEPRLGSEAELEALVTAAHARGMRVVLDYVINHVHADHEHAVANPGWFRTGCTCGTAGCGWTERRLDCLFRSYLPDVDWRHPDAAAAFVDDALWWLTRFDLDGLRVDAVKHVEDIAVFNLSSAVNEALEQAGTEYFLLGETAMGWAGHSLEANAEQYETISRYIGPRALSGQFDFVLYHAVSYNVFAHRTYGLLHADYWTHASLAAYPAGAIMTPYIGSHDTDRFLTLASGGTPDEATYQRAAVAFTWVLTLPGAPLLYYGDEYGELGGHDPDNRRMWRPTGQRTAHEQVLADHIGRVGRARARSPALRRGDYVTLSAGETFLAVRRTHGAHVAVVALNLADAPTTRTFDLGLAGGVTGSTPNVLDPGAAPFPVEDGAITMTLPARSAAIVLEQYGGP